MEHRGRRIDLASRATLALALLAGYYVLGLLIAGGLLYLAWRLADTVGGRAIRVVVPLVAGAATILWSLVPRRDVFAIDGLLLTREAQPRLFAVIDSIAVRTRQAAPTEVYLVPEVNAFVAQRGGFLGFGGQRVMGVGLPLLAALSSRQAESVIAHEFGHFAAGDTRLAPLVFQARAAVDRTLAGLGDSVLHLPFRSYGMLFMRISQQVARRQEFAADEVSARLTDPATAIASLRRLPATSALFNRFIRADFHPVLSHGYRPSLVYGFQRALAAPEHAEWTAEVVSNVLEHETDNPYASHPTVRARIAALQALAGANAQVKDDGPEEASALVWLDDIGGLEASLVDSLFVDGRTPAMRPIQWEDVGDEVVVPNYVVSLMGMRDHLAGLRPIDLPPTVERREALLADFTDGHPEELSETAARSALTSFFSAALSVALVQRGWRLESLPEQRHVRLSAPDVATSDASAAADEIIDPFHLVESLLDGTLAADEWRRTCAALGIADMDLAAAVEAERDRLIEAGRLERPEGEDAEGGEGAPDVAEVSSIDVAV